ncbi:MAG: DEAD/DEAH box helicase family protein [Actinomycetota bacterium]|nr:DEAD/DEAH box helicase family protein [Actinomycetota bacterium]
MVDFGKLADTVASSGARHRFYDDPVGFAETCIRWRRGESLTPYQRETLAAIPTRRKVAVRGPHGLGKTTTAALAVLWFAVTRESSGVDWKIPTTAGAWRQLTHYLWPEITKWARRLDWDAVGCDPWSERTELLSLNIKLDHGQAFAAASDNAALLEGAHASELLYVFDEAKSIIPDTFDAAEGAFSGAGAGSIQAFALAMSTPGEPSGRFYDIHARKPGLEDWWARHVTVDEAVKAGRISKSWVSQRRKQWGADTALFANRVLGEFHSSDEDGVIPLAWVEAAIERWLTIQAAGMPLGGDCSVGVDVARSGGDKTVLAIRVGDVVTELRSFSREDTMATTGRVQGIVSAYPGCVPVVDVIGVGGGVVDRLRELKIRVDAFNASEGSERRDRSGELGFINTRAAAWWNLRELLDPAYGAVLALPPSDTLTGDLVAAHWKVTSAGRIQVESKDDIRKRIGRSTDEGDAVVQAVWRRSGDNSAEAWTAYVRRVTERAATAETRADPTPAPVVGTDAERRRAARNEVWQGRPW